jgi:hypothetical protein
MLPTLRRFQVGQAAGLRRAAGPPNPQATRHLNFLVAAMLLCGAANPGRSRLSGGPRPYTQPLPTNPGPGQQSAGQTSGRAPPLDNDARSPAS